MNQNEIDKGQALGDDLEDEVVAIEPYEGDPDFDRPQGNEDNGTQDDEVAPVYEEEDDDA